MSRHNVPGYRGLPSPGRSAGSGAAAARHRRSRIALAARWQAPSLASNRERDATRDVLRILVAPGANDGPASELKMLRVPQVSLAVCGQLGPPVVSVRGGLRRMLRAPVPPATVDEDGDPLLREDDVRSYGPRPPFESDGLVHPISQAATMEGRANSAFWTCVPPTIRLHDPSTRLGYVYPGRAAQTSTPVDLPG